MLRRATILICVITAGAALAHQGVTNPQVAARMALMEDIGAGLKVLGQMARERRPFDAELAQTTQSDLIAHAAQVLPLFETRATDPESEALDRIWTSWPDFADRSEDMAKALRQLDVTSPERLSATIGPLAKSCRSCHEAFRIKD